MEVFSARPKHLLQFHSNKAINNYGIPLQIKFGDSVPLRRFDKVCMGSEFLNPKDASMKTRCCKYKDPREYDLMLIPKLNMKRNLKFQNTEKKMDVYECVAHKEICITT